MIHIVFGAPGMGKSSKLVHFVKELYQHSGRALLASSCADIAKIRAAGHNFVYPDRPPIFSDFPIRIKFGYEKYFETYFINGYYLGLPNDCQEVMYVPPGSVIFLSEAQRYFYSRKSSTFPDWVSRFYEMHRHYGLDIYMDVQRPVLIDANIRELSQHFIEIVKLEHERNFAGRIESSTWHCREWDNWKRVEAFMNTGEENYETTSYTNKGDIFDCYNSFSYFDKFLPSVAKSNLYLPHGGRIEDKQLEKFYDLAEPTTYRGGKKQ